MISGGALRFNIPASFAVASTLLIVAIACDSDSVTGPGYVCDVTKPVSEIQFSPVSSPLLVHSPSRAGDTLTVVASAFNRAGNVRTDVPISFESSDTTIATIDERGVLHARKPGVVRVTAKSCGTSAKIDVTVALFASTLEIRFDTAAIVAGDSVLVRARAVSQDSVPIPASKFTFTFTGPAGTTVTQKTDSTALVKTPATSSSGTVLVTANGEGISGSAPLTVVRRVVDVTLDTIQVVAGDSVLVTAKARPQDSQNAISGAVISFTSSPSSGVTITPRSSSSAMIKTSSAGTFVITASNLGVTATTTLTAFPRIFVGSLTGAEAGVDAGRDFNCGLISLGRLYCWGLNEFFELGAKTDSLCFDEGPTDLPANPCRLIPIRVADPPLVFTSVSAGDQFACGLNGSAKIYCWGDGTNGRLGNGRNAGSNVPTPITSGISFSSVSAGGNHACALSTTNAAYCWGLDSAGQLGDARTVTSTTPIPVISGEGIATYSSISAGFRHTCALNSAGSAFCWGLNNNGQLGAGTAGSQIDRPTAVLGGLTFKAISAGGDTVRIPGTNLAIFQSHTCALTTAGAAYCWGSNESGQLGNGTVGGSENPIPVAVAGGITFAKISAGARFTCGLSTSGEVYCWGRNRDLQLGRGPLTDTDADVGTPQRVSGGELPSGVTFVSVSAGRRHACGVATDGAAYCWGSNVFGALGNTLQAAFRGLPQRVATPQ